MELTDTEKLFANISKKYGGEKVYHRNEEWAMIGAKTFKRKVLGFFGTTAVKSLEEMTEALCETGIASSPEEAKEIVPRLVDERIDYDPFNELVFREVAGMHGEKEYKIISYCKDSKKGK